MKKLCFVIIFLAFFGLFTFGNDGEQEEIDYLLFLPNSSSEFVNEAQVRIQLDNAARYLRGRNLIAGQISVYGYSAFADVDIDPMSLSLQRAAFVMNELQRRGVSAALFSPPIGHGTVELWGSNIDEEARSPNRRVRILIDGIVLTPAIAAAPPIEVVTAADEPAGEQKYPWWLLIPLLLLPLILILLKKKKKTEEKPIPAPAPAAKIEVTVITVNLDPEIRFRAYEHHLSHCWEYVDVDGDWYKAVVDINTKYEGMGYQTYSLDGIWWAKKSE